MPVGVGVLAVAVGACAVARAAGAARDRGDPGGARCRRAAGRRAEGRARSPPSGRRVPAARRRELSERPRRQHGAERIAILTCGAGGARAGVRTGAAWLVLATVLAIIAAARVYERRHWPSGYGGRRRARRRLRPARDPASRCARGGWRTIWSGLALAVRRRSPAARGSKIAFPAGTAASRSSPLEHVTFGGARPGSLHGDWARDAPDPRRHSAWLRSDAGSVVLPAGRSTSTRCGWWPGRAAISGRRVPAPAR